MLHDVINDAAAVLAPVSGAGMVSGLNLGCPTTDFLMPPKLHKFWSTLRSPYLP